MTAEWALTIKKLREKYPSGMLLINDYAKDFHRSRASAYNDIKRYPALAVRPFGPHGPQRILLEVAISRAFTP